MPEKILVVDDDAETLEVMSLFLSRLGYIVVGAASGIDALDAAHREQPDLVVLDVMMPGMDGFEVARNLQRTPDTSSIPILMVTARNSDQDKERGYAAGVDIYLTKPLHRMDFQANVKSLLMQRKAQKMVLNDQGYLLGVIAPKGGLGVSTTALNLAAAYIRRFGVKVIAAELRAGHGTWGDELDISEQAGVDQLIQMDAFSISPIVVENQLAATNFGARLLLASNNSGVPNLSKGSVHYESILSALGTLASLVVLDAGTPYSPAFPAVVAQCSEMLVVTEPQPLAVKQTCRLLELLRASGFGASKPVSVVTVNHTRSDTILSISQVESILGRPVALGFPPALELAAQAQRQAVPMVLLQPESLAAQQFIKLAELVNKHIEG